MSNVDRCVRECEKALCETKIDEIDKSSKIIYNLPNENKVNILKNKTIKDITNYLLNASRYIKHSIACEFYESTNNYNQLILVPSSNNNKIGADLIHVLPNKKQIDIEVKFGAKTDGQIGMLKFNKIFSCTFFSDELKKARMEWQKQYLKEYPNNTQQFKRLCQLLNKCIKQFNNYLKTINYQLPKQNQKFMEDELLNNSGSVKDCDYYMKFDFKTNTPKKIKPIILSKGIWMIEEVNKLDEKEDELKERVNINLYNSYVDTKIRFTLNWKNDKVINGIKTQAKLALGSPSWNFWVTVDVLDSTEE